MAQSEDCFKGWLYERGNHNGDCCCNCEYRRPIMAHPWNDKTWAKGYCSQQIGWGCCIPDMDGQIIFFDLDHGHGMCECHKRLPTKKDMEKTQNENCTGK